VSNALLSDSQSQFLGSLIIFPAVILPHPHPDPCPRPPPTLVVAVYFLYEEVRYKILDILLELEVSVPGDCSIWFFIKQRILAQSRNFYEWF
jgi:hypothetical protein